MQARPRIDLETLLRARSGRWQPPQRPVYSRPGQHETTKCSSIFRRYVSITINRWSSLSKRYTRDGFLEKLITGLSVLHMVVISAMTRGAATM